MRSGPSQSPNQQDEEEGNNFNFGLHELLNVIHGRTSELRNNNRSRSNNFNSLISFPARTTTSRRRRFQNRIPNSKTLSIISGVRKKEKIVSTLEYPLFFDIISTDGGEYNCYYPITNILTKDENVYCSQKKSNVNILFKFNPKSTGVTDHTCVITTATAQSPNDNFTAPCTEFLLFISHKMFTIEDMAKYDDFTEAKYNLCLKKPLTHPWPVRDLPIAAYFNLKKNEGYRQTIEVPYRSAKFLGIKLLRALTDSDNIDFQYFGVRGFAGPRNFSQADLI